MRVALNADLIVRAKVSNYYGERYDGVKLAYDGVKLAMEVEVLEVLKGQTRAKKIRIWGDDGRHCRPYVSAFPLQTEWLFAIEKLPADERYPEDYYISNCGEYWLAVKESKVVGHIAFPRDVPSSADEKQTMSLDELRKKLTE